MLRISTAIIAILMITGTARAQCSCTITVRTADDLVRMSRGDLEAVYRASEIGTIPMGSTRGRAIFNPGSRLTVPLSRGTRVLWQGKAFPEEGKMINRIAGVRAIDARVFIGESWLDGKPTLVLDYYETTLLFKDVRDEIREVAPGIYLGVMYYRQPGEPKLAMFFTLDSNPRPRLFDR